MSMPTTMNSTLVVFAVRPKRQKRKQVEERISKTVAVIGFKLARCIHVYKCTETTDKECRYDLQFFGKTTFKKGRGTSAR